VNWDKLIPWMESEEIRKHANAFLVEYNPEGVLPLPIEEIVEFKIGINIVPIHGLQARIETVGFITSDLTEIDLDLEVSEKYPARFRWTIAHEVGHLLLHRSLYESQRFSKPEEWKKWVGTIPDKQYRWLEAQANMLASRILMPADALAEHFENIVALLKNGGLNWTAAPDAVYRLLADKFGVSPKSVMFALSNEGLAEDPRVNS